MNKSLDKFLKRAQEEIKPDEDLLLLTVFAGILAAFGIALNNTFVLIGAMLISPFFDPIISLGLFTIAKEFKKVAKALFSLVIITIFSLASSFITFLLLNYFVDINQIEYSLPNEIGAYFIIAVCLGIIGMLLWIWPKTSNTSAGISIGISLVPPLANIGKGIVDLNIEVITNSLLSFSLNTIGIILGVFLVVLLKRKS